ncbi:MAG: extracellular solute-binding protein [Gemmataceae bacterium]|nr:extracellular solute-binding protein [Gemmataceae bacterium]
MTRHRTRALILGVVIVVLIGVPLIFTWGGPRVVVYCAHDRKFAEPILAEFTKRTGLRVDKRYDTEANKSVGLYDDLVREASRPRCDVHWNNEILATIRLERQGVYAPYQSPSALPYPAQFKAADHTWTAFAARARVLVVNTTTVSPEQTPTSLRDLVKPEWKGRLAMAKPLFGTTATHAACLFQAWGPDQARTFFERLRANDVQIVAGNKQVAAGVGVGQFDLGLTDTDDALAEIDQGRPVTMIFLDADAAAGSGQGTLFIPNTVAFIKDCPNPDGAKKLIDYLLSPEVEAMLAEGQSRQIPLNPQVKAELPAVMQPARTARAFPVDFAKATDAWDESQTFLKDTFGLR